MSCIYLVDDHVIVRDGLRAVLQAAGHEVSGESGNPTQALADVLRLRPDLVMLDLNLRDRSGFELLEELQRRAMSMRCLVLTMSAQPRHVAEALRLGAAGYVLKGSPGSEVLHAIGEVTSGRRYLGKDVGDLAAQALAAGNADDPLTQLSARERQVIALVVRGHSSSSVGQLLHLSPKTVDTYRSRLMGKLGVSDLAGLVRLAVRKGLVDDEQG